MSDNSSNSSKMKGNTSPSSSMGGVVPKVKKQISPAKRWVFTYFYKDESEIDVIVPKFQKISNFIIGKETCPTTGKMHLQGYVVFEKKVRPANLLSGAHWEKALAGDIENYIYCSKENVICNTLKSMSEELKTVDPLEGLVLRDWQKDCLDLLSLKPDNRTIHWYWEHTGNIGKTTLCKHIALTKNSIVLGGKGADIKHGIAMYIAKNKQIDVCVFHFTRTNEDYVSYEALEAVKDGIFYSGKFESGMVLYNCPHVIVMANFPPEMSKMSRDRWIVHDLNPKVEFDDEFNMIL